MNSPLIPVGLGWEKIAGNETSPPASVRWDNKCSPQDPIALSSGPSTGHLLTLFCLTPLSVMAMIRHLRLLDRRRACRVDSTQSSYCLLSPSSTVRQRVTQYTCINPHGP